MTVQFPDGLVIAGAFEIEIGNQAEVIGAGGFAADIIAPPIDIRAGLDRSTHQREAVL
jgi:hypothetical protein